MGHGEMESAAHAHSNHPPRVSPGLCLPSHRFDLNTSQRFPPPFLASGLLAPPLPSAAGHLPCIMYGAVWTQTSTFPAPNSGATCKRHSSWPI